MAIWMKSGRKKAINIHSVSRVYHFLFAQGSRVLQCGGTGEKGKVYGKEGMFGAGAVADGRGRNSGAGAAKYAMEFGARSSR